MRELEFGSNMLLRMLCICLATSMCLAQPELEVHEAADTVRAVIKAESGEISASRAGIEQALGLQLRGGPGLFSCQRRWTDEGWSANLAARLAIPEAGLEMTGEYAPATQWDWAARAWIDPGPVYLAAGLREGSLSEATGGLRYAGFDAGVRWAEERTSWRAGFSRWGLRCGAQGSLNGWETPWRQYDVDCDIQLTEGISVGAGVSRKLEGEETQDTGRGNLQVKF